MPTLNYHDERTFAGLPDYDQFTAEDLAPVRLWSRLVEDGIDEMKDVAYEAGFTDVEVKIGIWSDKTYVSVQATADGETEIRNAKAFADLASMRQAEVPVIEFNDGVQFPPLRLDDYASEALATEVQDAAGVEGRIQIPGPGWQDFYEAAKADREEDAALGSAVLGAGFRAAIAGGAAAARAFQAAPDFIPEAGDDGLVDPDFPGFDEDCSCGDNLAHTRADARLAAQKIEEDAVAEMRAHKALLQAQIVEIDAALWRVAE